MQLQDPQKKFLPLYKGYCHGHTQKELHNGNKHNFATKNQWLKLKNERVTMITLHRSYKFSVTSQRYCSAKTRTMTQSMTCTHTCLGGLSLRGTQKAGSFHQEGQRITHRYHYRQSLTWQRDEGTQYPEVSLSASQPQGEASCHRTAVPRKTAHGFCQRPHYNLVGLGLIIVHSHGLEISGLRPLTGRRCNLLTKGI